MGANPMTTDGISPAPTRERLLVAAICLAAAFRVFMFCAAFPFFNNVDETSHFDLVYKYSRGHLPAAPLEKLDPQVVDIVVPNATGEYYGRPQDRSAQWLTESAAFLRNQDNRETWAWPTYYLLAGLWCWLGRLLGLTGGHLLYWIRFLNVPIVAAFVWLSYIFSRKLLPDGRQRIAVPLIIAFFPQDIFFSITSDVLSPLMFAAAFFMLLEICFGEKSWRYHLLTGLAVAATFLTKVSNITILPLAAAVFLIKIKQAVSQKQLKHYIPSLAAFAVTVTIPVALWLGRNYILFGDLVGAAKSMQLRTWTKKPFSEMFNHPIFTPSGLFFFLADLTKTFWRGEFIWRSKRMACPLMDWFYCVSSAVFLLASLLGVIINKPKMDKHYRFALGAALFVVTLSVVLLAVLSMRYDFGQCFYPSRAQPYFTSGRLIAGAILPFLLLYIDGLQRILAKTYLASRLLITVGVIVAAVTVCEIILTLPVFASTYNLFHLK